jgi:hypothetical protein
MTSKCSNTLHKLVWDVIWINIIILTSCVLLILDTERMIGLSSFSNAVIVNPAQGMDVCVCVYYVFVFSCV